MAQVLINIVRTICIFCLVIDIIIYAKKICFHIKRKKNIIYISSYLFWTIAIVKFLVYFLYIMTDIVKTSWNDSSWEFIVAMIIICGIFNLFSSICLWCFVSYKIVISDDRFTINNVIFGKNEIYFADIESKESAYVFEQKNTKWLFKHSLTSKYNEYILLGLKNGDKIKLNLYPFIFCGVEESNLLKIIALDMKIPRKLITK